MATATEQGHVPQAHLAAEIAGLHLSSGAPGSDEGQVLFWAQVEDLFPLSPPMPDPEDEQDRDPASRRNIAATFEVLCELLEQGIEATLPTAGAADELADRIRCSFYCVQKWHRVVDALVDVLCKNEAPGPVLLFCTTTLLHLAAVDHGVYRRLSKCPDPRLIRALAAAIWPIPAHVAHAPQDNPNAVPASNPAWNQTPPAAPPDRTLDTVPAWPHAPPPQPGDDSAAAEAYLDTLHAQIAALQADLRVKAVQLFYLLCKVQLMHPAQLEVISASFINHLFDLVEETRDQQDEFFNYHIILLLLALNEQFMVAALTDNAPSNGSVASGLSGVSQHKRTKSARPRANLVVNVLRLRLHASKTFSENIIFMLNRTSHDVEEDMCIQLLILKLLYVLFTTPDLALFFYTNDLKVLLDIFIREIQDLPDERDTLRHTYLRVLHPLMLNTQLRANSYKQPEIRSLLLRLLAQQQFREVDPATIRLCNRCLTSEWCVLLAQTLDPAVPGTEADSSVPKPKERSLTAPDVSEPHPPAARTNSAPHPCVMPPEATLTEAVSNVQALAQVVRDRADSKGDLKEHDPLAEAHAQADAVSHKVAQAELHHGHEKEASLGSTPHEGRPRAISTSGLRPSEGEEHAPVDRAGQHVAQALHHDSGKEALLGSTLHEGRPRAVSTSLLRPSDAQGEEEEPSPTKEQDALRTVAPAPAGLVRRTSVLARQASTRRRRASVSSIAEDRPGVSRRPSRTLPPVLKDGKEWRQASTRPVTPLDSVTSEGEGATPLPLPVPHHLLPGTGLDSGVDRSASPFPDHIFFPPTPPMGAHAVRGRRKPPPPGERRVSAAGAAVATGVGGIKSTPPPVDRSNKPSRSPGRHTWGHTGPHPPHHHAGAPGLHPGPHPSAHLSPHLGHVSASDFVPPASQPAQPHPHSPQIHAHAHPSVPMARPPRPPKPARHKPHRPPPAPPTAVPEEESRDEGQRGSISAASVYSAASVTSLSAASSTGSGSYATTFASAPMPPSPPAGSPLLQPTLVRRPAPSPPCNASPGLEPVRTTSSSPLVAPRRRPPPPPPMRN